LEKLLKAEVRVPHCGTMRPAIGREETKEHKFVEEASAQVERHLEGVEFPARYISDPAA